jgi:hypothetical protein
MKSDGSAKGGSNVGRQYVVPGIGVVERREGLRDGGVMGVEVDKDEMGGSNNGAEGRMI